MSNVKFDEGALKTLNARIERITGLPWRAEAEGQITTDLSIIVNWSLKITHTNKDEEGNETQVPYVTLKAQSSTSDTVHSRLCDLYAVNIEGSKENVKNFVQRAYFDMCK